MEFFPYSTDIFKFDGFFFSMILHLLCTPYAYSRPYIYHFRQIFQVLRLFPALRLFWTLEYLEKFKKNLCPQKVEKPPKNVIYLWQLGVLFSAAPTAQNSPVLHFRFINSPIQSPVLKSVVRIIQKSFLNTVCAPL